MHQCFDDIRWSSRGNRVQLACRGPEPPLASVMRTAWIFQFPLDPAKRLLREGLHILTSPVLD